MDNQNPLDHYLNAHVWTPEQHAAAAAYWDKSPAVNRMPWRLAFHIIKVRDYYDAAYK